jgi:superoxide dismutase
MHNAPRGYPLLVLDMYEHAYHVDYGEAAAKYEICWSNWSRNCEKTKQRRELLLAPLER